MMPTTMAIMGITIFPAVCQPSSAETNSTRIRLDSRILPVGLFPRLQERVHAQGVIACAEPQAEGRLRLTSADDLLVDLELHPLQVFRSAGDHAECALDPSVPDE